MNQRLDCECPYWNKEQGCLRTILQCPLVQQKPKVSISIHDEDALFQGSHQSFHERLVKMLKSKGIEVEEGESDE